MNRALLMRAADSQAGAREDWPRVDWPRVDWPRVDCAGLARSSSVLLKLDVIVSDLLDADVEAIVNAANSELWMGGGVAGAIKLAAGAKVEREAMAQGPIQPGQAVATSAGRLPLPIRWVIHAATMGPDLKTSEANIRSATTSALVKAVEVGARSVAFPALGTGVGGFPIERAAQVMVGAFRQAAETGRAPERVVFVLRNEAAAAAFRDADR